MAVASFHLHRFPKAQIASALARVPLDRRRLRRVPGLRFARLLGTGRGETLTASADLRRWALFAVWDHDDDVARFLGDHPIATSWWPRAQESYHLRLLPAGAHGRWGGVDPLAGTAPADDRHGPVAVLTRATVHPTKLRSFQHAVPPVDARVHEADGLLAAVGVGEAPVGQQATFSLWRDRAAVRRFAYDDDAHAEVIRRTRTDGWYREEWFARFVPTHSSGTWDGRDPLAG